MTIRWLLAALHLLALGIGLGAIWARGRALDTGAASRFARISFIQAGLVVLMVLAATAMARGYGVPKLTLRIRPPVPTSQPALGPAKATAQ